MCKLCPINGHGCPHVCVSLCACRVLPKGVFVTVDVNNLDIDELDPAKRNAILEQNLAVLLSKLSL